MVGTNRIVLRRDQRRRYITLRTLPWRSAEVRPFARAPFGTFWLFLILLSIFSGGCQERDKTVARGEPVIEFTDVPVAGAGNARAHSSHSRTLMQIRRGETRPIPEPCTQLFLSGPIIIPRLLRTCCRPKVFLRQPLRRAWSRCGLSGGFRWGLWWPA